MPGLRRVRKYTTGSCFRVTQMHKSYTRTFELARSHLRFCRTFMIFVHDDMPCFKPELRFWLSTSLSIPELVIPAVDGPFYKIFFAIALRKSPTERVVSVYLITNL